MTFTHEDLYPYPTDLNTPAKVMLTKLTGGEVETACAVHAAWQIVGVGLNAALPDVHTPVIFGGCGPHTPCSEEECERVLREVTAVRGEGSIIPDELKKQLFQVALTLLLKWLGL